MRLITIEQALQKAIQGIAIETIDDISYIPVAGLSTLTSSSMRTLILLSAAPKHTSDFCSINGQIYIKEVFLYELFEKQKIAQTTHVERLQGIEMKAVNTDGPPLKLP